MSAVTTALDASHERSGRMLMSVACGVCNGVSSLQRICMYSDWFRLCGKHSRWCLVHGFVLAQSMGGPWPP